LTKGARRAVAAAIGLAVAAGGAVTVYSVLRARFFPGRYRVVVTAAADEFGLDPLLVAGVVHCESGFRPQARSSAGARGLMQLMPATAEEAAGKLGITGYDEALLDEPAVNLRLGCAHLRELLDRFDGDMRVALAAYNAGSRHAAGWLEAAQGDVERMLTEHAFPVTRTYVRDVLRTRSILEWLDAIDGF
jgi:soluble lytic murein transglycosylase